MPDLKSSAIAHTALGPIEYLQSGREHERGLDVIVSIHGAMGGYEQSDILARAVAPPKSRYIAVSRPGYLGTPLEGRESPEAQADLLAALLDALDIKKVVLLAISGGGYSALNFALRHPARLRALVLCSTTGGKNTVPIPFAFQIMKLAARMPWFARFMRDRFLKNVENSLMRSLRHQDLAEKMMQDDQLMSLYKELTLSTFERMAERIPGTVNDIRVTRETEYQLEDISAPALVVHGTDDAVVPFNEHGKQLAERLPQSRLCVAERGEHMAVFTHNEQVREAVKNFLLTPGL